MSNPPPAHVLDALVANHRRFLDFLERHVGDRSEAEDLLQAAFVRTLERGGGLRAGESAVAWFHRLLRNALIDRRRSEGTREHALAALAREEGDGESELEREVCRCVLELLPALRDEYSELVRRVDLEGRPVKEAAAELGITPNNAGVRLHRARKALFRELQRSCGTCATHGCLDCRCGSRGGCSPGV